MQEKRTIAVEFLYLDLTNCGRCVGTGSNLTEAIDRLSPTLNEIGVQLDVRRIHVRTKEEARRRGLEISPTVRVEGRDIQSDWTASECGGCDDLCCPGSTKVDCRLWDWAGEKHTVAPVPLLMRAILAECFSGEVERRRKDGDELSENLERFFQAKVASSRRTSTERTRETASRCCPECC